jgi:hypothetical protein
MRVRSLIGLSLFAFLALGGKCVIFISTHPSPHHHHHVLAPGQVVQTAGLHVHFLIVVSDSRCPIDRHCPAAGDAVVAMKLNAGGASAQVELQAIDPAKRTAMFEGYVIELTSLDPRPNDGQTIDPASYRATIDVRRQ